MERIDRGGFSGTDFGNSGTRRTATGRTEPAIRTVKHTVGMPVRSACHREAARLPPETRDIGDNRDFGRSRHAEAPAKGRGSRFGHYEGRCFPECPPAMDHLDRTDNRFAPRLTFRRGEAWSGPEAEEGREAMKHRRGFAKW